MSSFTYIISSADDLTNPSRAWNSYITLGGLPEGVRYFRCRVLNFAVNPCSFDAVYNADTHIFHLASPNFMLDGARSGNKQFNIISTVTNKQPIMQQHGAVFKIANFNGKTINFQFLNEYEISSGLLLNQNGNNTIWVLTLELTPIDNCCY